ncbi:MAG TPA: SDR family oxidoreductase [Chthoniobacteraceae bacterium]|jgi:short-subunit dehydrogenase|nr:SDR family oxidoreductase [Chthoniobacteraceae bacterium]
MFANCCGCCRPPSIPEAFRQRVALITGASSGLGAEYARRLAPHVSALLLVARRQDRLEALRAELARPGLEIQCHALDLADRGALDDFLAAIAESAPAIDLVINNAGVGDHGFFETSDWARGEAMLEVNIRALTRITHALVPRLVRAGGGAVLNVSSLASFVPVPQMAVYAATKAYVSSFTEALRAELRGTGVTVTHVCPGPVATEFSQVAGRPGEPDMMQSPEFIRVSAGQVVRESLEAVAADRARVLPGRIVWGIAAVLALIPMALLRLGSSQRFRRPVSRRRRF